MFANGCVRLLLLRAGRVADFLFASSFSSIVLASIRPSLPRTQCRILPVRLVHLHLHHVDRVAPLVDRPLLGLLLPVELVPFSPLCSIRVDPDRQPPLAVTFLLLGISEFGTVGNSSAIHTAGGAFGIIVRLLSQSLTPVRSLTISCFPADRLQRVVRRGGQPAHAGHVLLRAPGRRPLQEGLGASRTCVLLSPACMDSPAPPYHLSRHIISPRSCTRRWPSFRASTSPFVLVLSQSLGPLF